MSTEGRGAKPPSTPTREIRLPDLGTTAEVSVVELLVRVGDTVEKDTPLVTLESDKATMEVPSPMPGVVAKIRIQPGDKVATGAMIMELGGAPQLKAEEVPAPAAPHPRQAEPYGGEPYLSTIPVEPLMLGQQPGSTAPASSSPAASVSMSAASRRKPCCMPRRSSRTRGRWSATGSLSGRRRSM